MTNAWTDPTGYDFRLWRLTAHLGQVEAARFLGVAPRTVRHWEGPRGRVPYAAFKLMKIRAGYALPDPNWNGWTFRQGLLWSPAGQPFDPGFMSYLSLVFRMAEAWRSEKTAKAGPARLSGLAADGARPPAAPGCPAPPRTVSEAANDPDREDSRPHPLTATNDSTPRPP